MKTFAMLPVLVIALGACAGDASSDADATALDVPGQDAIDPDVPVDRDVPDVAVPDVPVMNDLGADLALDGTDGTADADACVPDCSNNRCRDGCGGSCSCPDGLVCNLLMDRCPQPQCWLTKKPTSWGAASVVSTLLTPPDAEVVKATCFDYTGDGLGDNGAKGMAGQFNGPLADAIAAGKLALLIELAGVTDFTDTASFQLNGLLGTSTADPPSMSGDFYVQEASYVTDICRPMIYFEGAKITAGMFEAGPSEFQWSIPLEEGLVIDLTFVQAKLKGTIPTGASAEGFQVEGGVLSGVLTKEQMSVAVGKMQDYCNALADEAKPQWCSMLTNSYMAFTFFDLHQNGDGTFSAKTKDLPGDAMSICMTFTGASAKVVGFVPVEVP